MPVLDTKKYQRGVTEWTLLPEEIEVLAELNGRYELPDIDYLVKSILAHGQLQPIAIRKTGGKPVLVAGFSRWRAVSKINADGLTPKPLRLRCSYTQLTEKEAFLANIAENSDRNATTPIDDAHNIQRLINVYQMSLEDIKTAYRAQSVAWVKARLELIQATPEVEKAIRSGKIKGKAERTIAKLSREHQKNLAALAEEKGKVTPEDIRREVGEPQKQPTPPAAARNATEAAAPEPAAGPHKALAIETYRAILAEAPYEELIARAIKGLEGYGLKQ
jgi:ParB/RepB/Spo0J family partition protein